MFIINDIELLVRLGKHRILQAMLVHCSIAISSLKLSAYSFQLQKEVDTYAKIPILHCDEGFIPWCYSKGFHASPGDLSSMYATLQNFGTLILSHEEDLLLPEVARYGVPNMAFDDFVLQNTKDDHMIQLYNLIKVA